MFTRFNLDVLTRAGDVNPAFTFGFSVFDFSGFAFGFFAGLYGVLELWPYFAFYGLLAFGLNFIFPTFCLFLCVVKLSRNNIFLSSFNL